MGRHARASARCSSSMCLAHLATVWAMREVLLWLTLCGHMQPCNTNKKDRQKKKKTDRKERIIKKQNKTRDNGGKIGGNASYVLHRGKLNDSGKIQCNLSSGDGDLEPVSNAFVSFWSLTPHPQPPAMSSLGLGSAAVVDISINIPGLAEFCISQVCLLGCRLIP